MVIIIPDETGVQLNPVDTRPKSEKYACSGCGGFCYYPHSKTAMPYKFCPNCGKVVKEDAQTKTV